MASTIHRTNPIRKAFASNMRTLRLLRGLTQEELAKKMGCDRITIVRHEGGHNIPTFEFACRLADMLGCDVASLRRDLSKGQRTA